MALSRALATLAGLALLSALSSGCASIFEGTTQQISVTTTPAGARCTFWRNGTLISDIASTPGSVTIRKTKDDLTIVCDKRGYGTATYVNHSGLAMATFANILTAGLAWAYNSTRGADNKYEGQVSLALPPASAVPIEAAPPEYVPPHGGRPTPAREPAGRSRRPDPGRRASRTAARAPRRGHNSNVGGRRLAHPRDGQRLSGRLEGREMIGRVAGVILLGLGLALTGGLGWAQTPRPAPARPTCPAPGTIYTFTNSSSIQALAGATPPFCRFANLNGGQQVDLMLGAFSAASPVVQANLDVLTSLLPLQVGKTVTLARPGADSPRR